MKKLLCVLAAIAVGSVAFADMSVGVKGTINGPSAGSSFGDGKFKDDLDTSMNLLGVSSDDVQSSEFSGSLLLFANFDLYRNDILALGVQPEFGIGGNEWHYFDATATVMGSNYDYTSAFSWVTVDIPVLFTAEFKPLSWLGLQVGIGPQISFNLKSGGDQTLNNTVIMTLEGKPGATFGMVFDANAKFHFFSSALIAGFRYSMDFTPSKFDVKDLSRYDDSEIYRRYAAFTIGFEKTFKK